MKIIVQKYGGTSVATAESREHVYRKILKAKETGYAVVVVISAMGRKGSPYATDTLLDLIRLDCPEANQREQDLIFSCGEIISGTLITVNLQHMGHSAMYLTGQQAGILTSAEYGDARILQVNTEKIKELLNQNYIVVVAGGQGATADGSITALGRGGSDTTACALGTALDAEEIQIYTDVEGMLTTDPRIVKEAMLISEISYENCCEMAYQGAKVMHPRAVEIASQKPNTKLYVRSVFSDSLGTLITNPRSNLPLGTDLPETVGVVGIALLDKLSMFKAVGLEKGKKAPLLEALKGLHRPIYEMHPEIQSVILSMDDKDVDEVKRVIDSMNIMGEWFKGLSKISLVGENLAKSDWTAHIISALESSGIDMIATASSPNVIETWIQEKSTEAVKTVHELLVQVLVSKEGLIEKN